MLLREKNRLERIIEYLFIDIVFSEIFSALLIVYLLANLVELLFPGAVSFGVSLNFLFWLTAASTIIFAYLERDKIIVSKEEKFNARNFGLKSYILLFFLSIASFFVIYEKIKQVGRIGIIIAIIIAIIILGLGILTIGEQKKGKKNIGCVRGCTRKSLFIAAALLSIWCAYSFLVPSGFLTFRINPISPSRFITEFAKKEMQVLKVSDDGKDYYRTIYQNPLFFSVQIPRLFKKADVSVTYKPVTTNAAVSIGVKRAKGGMEYTLAADYQPLLENMPQQWQKVEGDEYDAWVRNKAYDKVLEDIGKEKKIQEENLRKKFQEDTEKLNRQVQSETITQDVYASARKELQQKLNADLANNAEPKIVDVANFINPYKTILDVLEKSNTPFSRISTYRTSSDQLFAAESLGSFDTTNGYHQSSIMRGSHALIGYVQDTSLQTGTITIVDSNRHENGDPVTVTITQNNVIVLQKKLDDDGNQSPNNKASNERTIVFKDLALKKGIFHISISTNDDVFIKRIQLASPFAAFTKSIYIADSLAYENIFPGSTKTTTLFTNSTSLTFITSHKEGFQDIAVNKRSVKIFKADEKVTIDQLEGITKIVIPKGDVKVAGDGVFSFQEKSPLLFYKNTNLASVATVDQLSQYDVLLASYKPSEKQGEWQVARASIDSPNLGYPDKIAEIGIDFGKLGIDARKVIVKEITVTFVKDPITVSKIISKIRGFFD